MKKATISDTSRNNALLVAVMAMLFAFLSPFLQDIGDIPSGLLRIITASSQLLSDYFHIGGPGAALINSAVILLMELLVIHLTGAMLTGTLMAGLFTTAGFAFFGTNPLNSLPIIAGAGIPGNSHCPYHQFHSIRHRPSPAARSPIRGCCRHNNWVCVSHAFQQVSNVSPRLLAV